MRCAVGRSVDGCDVDVLGLTVWCRLRDAMRTDLLTCDIQPHPTQPQVEALYGVTKTREVYQKAIETLPDEGAKNMCLEYAEVERKLGEVRRKGRGFVGGDGII